MLLTRAIPEIPVKDVSSFANAAGGDLIFGLRQEDGIPREICGIEVQNIDDEKLRIENMLRDGIEPRIPGISIREITESDKEILIVRIPKSWALPHVVKYKGHWRFYSRNSAGAYPLDVPELRAAFLVSDSIGERIQKFRSVRLGKMIADEMPMSMPNSPKVVLHLVPFNAAAPGSIIDITDKKNFERSMIPIHSSGHNSRYNFDGFISYSPSDTSNHSYVQLFRNGSVEAVSAYLIDPHGILIGEFEWNLINSAKTYIELLKTMSIQPPIFIMLSLLGVRGCRMAIHRSSSFSGSPIDRDNLIIPEVIVDNLEIHEVTILRSCFDAVWNAFGYAKSLNYDEQGNWQQRI